MKHPQPTIRIVTATEAKNNFGALIKSAYARDEHLIVEKSGIPVVAIIPMADYQQLVNNKATDNGLSERIDVEQRRAQAGRELKELLAQIHARMPIVSEEEADRDIARAIRETRNEQAKRAGLPKPLAYRQVRARRKKAKISK